MTYTNNIPNLNDLMQVLESQLRLNFTLIQSSFDINHVDFNATNAGKHSALILRDQGGDPATAADETALYNKTGTGSVPQLFYRPHSNGTPIQMSNNVLTNTGLRQTTFLAGPFIVYCGRVNNVTDNQLITLTPSCTTLISVLVTLTSDNYTPLSLPTLLMYATAENLTSGPPTTFNIRRSVNPSNIPGATSDIFYTAVGVV